MKNFRCNLTIGACIAAIGLALTITPAGALSDNDKTAVEAIIKDYLLKNPEVLRDALDVLEKRQAEEEITKQQAVIASHAKLIFNSPRAPLFGNPKGDVTLVEFFDYNCGYCKQAMSDVMQLAKDDPKLKIVFKELPVLGPGSLEAAKVAIAVRMQDKNNKYVEFHRRLLGGRGEANKERALAAAKDAGFDLAQIEKDMKSSEVGETLKESANLARALGVNGTPTFVIADELIIGAQGYDAMKGKIESTRKCGKATC